MENYYPTEIYKMQMKLILWEGFSLWRMVFFADGGGGGLKSVYLLVYMLQTTCLRMLLEYIHYCIHIIVYMLQSIYYSMHTIVYMPNSLYSCVYIHRIEYSNSLV